LVTEFTLDVKPANNVKIAFDGKIQPIIAGISVFVSMLTKFDLILLRLLLLVIDMAGINIIESIVILLLLVIEVLGPVLPFFQAASTVSQQIRGW